MKKKKNEEKKGIVESFLGGIPLLGDLVKELGKTETFKKRFEEADEKIEENLKTGQRRMWGFSANIAVRPILNKVKEETSEVTIKEDYFYGKKGNKLTLVVKVPKEDVGLEIKGKSLLIKSGNFIKKIELPNYYRNVEKRQYKKGILVLKLAK